MEEIQSDPDRVVNDAASNQTSDCCQEGITTG